MEKLVRLAALAASALVATAAVAEQDPWLVRARALDMEVDNGNSRSAVVPALGKLKAEDKVFPEVDFSYFFSEHWAAELILTYPQEHDLEFAGVGIGSVKHLPPTLTLQYHFLPAGTVRPYVGAGLNYTRFSDVKINGLPAVGVDSPIDVDRSSWGVAGQLGVDIQVAANWFLNLDAKYVRIEAQDVRITGGVLAGTKVTDLDVDPWLLSVGIGYRF